MSKYEDGSYSSMAGIALIAKVLAGRCKMNYTRVAVGKGEIPEDMTPKTMTEPAEYVMDAKIAAVTNPVNGECQVTVQINSSDVEHGFYCTGVLLYAEDPDEGEVPYTYLVLENGPEWIRPSSSAVGKLATFDLIAAVGDVDKVTASIDPDSIMTYSVVRQLISEATADVTVTVPKTGWKNDGDTQGEYALCCDIPIEGVTAKIIPNLTILPGGAEAADSCTFAHYCRTMDGGIRLYADRIPEYEFDVNVALLRCIEGTPGGGSGGGDYVLPVATATRLGGVKIPADSNLKIDGAGNLRVDEQQVFTDDDLLDEDSTEQELKDILLNAGETPGTGN